MHSLAFYLETILNSQKSCRNSAKDFFFLNHMQVSCWQDAPVPQIIYYIFPTNKDILLYSRKLQNSGS